MPSLRELYFQHMGLPSSTPLAIEVDRAEGIYFWDTSNKRYTDLVSGVAVSNVGHRHPRVVMAIEEQIGKYMHMMVYGEYIQRPQVRLAEKLSKLLPRDLDSVYFVNSGILDFTVRIGMGRSNVFANNRVMHLFGALVVSFL